MKISNNLCWLFISAVGFAGCIRPEKTDEQILIHVDIAFSEMAQKEGFGSAFIAYADSNAIIMQNGKLPLRGIGSISDSYENIPTHLVLSWHPIKAEISASGDLGYTFGEYTFTDNGSEETGHYVTIWKKNKAGKWKYVLDTGTENPKVDKTLQ